MYVHVCVLLRCLCLFLPRNLFLSLFCPPSRGEVNACYFYTLTQHLLQSPTQVPSQSIVLPSACGTRMTYFANAVVPRFMKKFFSICSTAGFMTRRCPSLYFWKFIDNNVYFIPRYAERFDKLNSFFDFIHVWNFFHLLVSPIILFCPSESFLHNSVSLVVVEAKFHDDSFCRSPFDGLVVRQQIAHHGFCTRR